MSANDETDCWTCRHRYNIPNNAHIGCSSPNPDMQGKAYGKANGWFEYPFCFDPVWKLTTCPHHEVGDPDYELRDLTGVWK